MPLEFLKSKTGCTLIEDLTGFRRSLTGERHDKTCQVWTKKINHMHNHAPSEYVCPFCLLVQSKESVESHLKQTDVVFRSADVTAFMATRKYPNNQGHVLVVPNEHFENIYDLPLDISAKVHALSRDISLAMKSEYHCDGIMLRQHNEPAGDQNIWHYHLHVIPRYQNDDFHTGQKSPFEIDERAQYAQKLRNWFSRSER